MGIFSYWFFFISLSLSLSASFPNQMSLNGSVRWYWSTLKGILRESGSFYFTHEISLMGVRDWMIWKKHVWVKVVARRHQTLICLFDWFAGNLLAELTMYGNHILHHLFPTLDHGLLDTVRPIYEKTAAEFGLPDELVHSPVPKGQWHYVLGMFGQLGRVEPRSSPASRPQSRRRTDSNENNLNNDSEIKKID